MAKGKILVVDDEIYIVHILDFSLGMEGYEVVAADSAEHALERVDAFMPDIALLDIGLPKMNGYDVARKIREQPWGKRILLVALTGWGQEEDRRRSREAGFDHHIIKPVEPDALLKLLTTMDD